MIRLGFTLLLLAMSGTAFAGECFADVEHINSTFNGREFFNTFRVSHDAGNGTLATVFFETRTTYVYKGKTFVESGVIREYVRGPTEQIVDDDMATFVIEQILAVEIINISCS